MKFDLEIRTLKFSKSIQRLIKGIRINITNENIVRQLLKSSSSIGANIREANETETHKEFRLKISYCRREAKETVYWLELLMENIGDMDQKLNILIDESNQLTLIFASIMKKTS